MQLASTSLGVDLYNRHMVLIGSTGSYKSKIQQYLKDHIVGPGENIVDVYALSLGDAVTRSVVGELYHKAVGGIIVADVPKAPTAETVRM